MKATMEEYGFIVVYVIVGIIAIGIMFALIFGDDDESLKPIMPKSAEQHMSTGDYSEYNNGLPILQTPKQTEIDASEGIDLLSDELVTMATDAEGTDIKDNVVVSRIVNVETGEVVESIPNDVPGTYDITYILLDNKHQRVKSKTRIVVNITAEVEEEP